MPTKRSTTAPAHAHKLHHHSVCEYPACTAPADHVDRIVEGAGNDWHNLQSHCKAHSA
jgi:hypothetical protein